MSSHCVIAIDGPAASGKSTVSRSLARQLGFAFVSSGLMYRSFTWVVLKAGCDPENVPAVLSLLEATQFEPYREGNELFILVNGTNPGPSLTSDSINQAVSLIARIPEVRQVLVRLQRACAAATDIVMEGRDIGSVVFPDTPFKFYLNASEEVRAMRRSAQGFNDAIQERDKMDTTRKASPLKIAEGAEVVDTSDLTIPGVVETILTHLNQKGLSTAHSEA